MLLVGSLLVALSMALGGGEAPHGWLAPVFAVLAGLHGWRLWRWHQPRLWRVPLLWSLYLAYLWLALATLGMALWHLGWAVPQSLVTHALAVGGLGGLVLGMIARVSLGHSGRPLQVTGAMAGAFALLFLAVYLIPHWNGGILSTANVVPAPSALLNTLKPAPSAFLAVAEPARSAIATSLTPLSRIFCAWAWPWLP